MSYVTSLFTSFTVGSSESEWTMALESFGSKQATRSTIPTRIHTADRRPLVLALRYVLTGHRRRRQVDRESADTQLPGTPHHMKHP